jgi:hypothetical protein
MSQVRRQLAIFTANHEIAFRASLSSAGTKLLRILSPEEWLLSRVPISVAGGATVWRGLAQRFTNAQHYQTF